MRLLGVSFKIFITGIFMVAFGFAAFLIDKEFNSTNFMESTTVTFVKRLDDESSRLVASNDKFETEEEIDIKKSQKYGINREMMRCNQKHMYKGKWQIFKRQTFLIENQEMNENPDVIDNKKRIVSVKLECNVGQVWTNRIVVNYGHGFERFNVNTIVYMSEYKEHKVLRTMGIYNTRGRDKDRSVNIVEMRKIRKVRQQIADRNMEIYKTDTEVISESEENEFPPKDLDLTLKKILSLPAKARGLIENLVELDPQRFNTTLNVKMEYNPLAKRYEITQIVDFTISPTRNSKKMKGKYNRDLMENFEKFMESSDNDFSEVNVNTNFFRTTTENNDVYAVSGTVMHTKSNEEEVVTLRFATGVLGDAAFIFAVGGQDNDSQEVQMYSENEEEISENEGFNDNIDENESTDQVEKSEEALSREEITEGAQSQLTDIDDKFLDEDKEYDDEAEDPNEEIDDEASASIMKKNIEVVGFKFQNKSIKRSVASVINEK